MHMAVEGYVYKSRHFVWFYSTDVKVCGLASFQRIGWDPRAGLSVPLHVGL